MSVFINNKWKIALATVLMCAIALVSCDQMPKECKKNLERPFWATVEGDVDGNHVKAEVYCDPTEHKTKEIFNRCTVTFLDPASLSGITVSLRSDGKATVRLKDTSVDMPLYREMTEPYLALTPFGELYSQGKTSEGYEMTYKQGEDTVTYCFGTDGIIKRVKGTVDSRSFSLNVISFKQINE